MAVDDGVGTCGEPPEGVSAMSASTRNLGGGLVRVVLLS